MSDDSRVLAAQTLCAVFQQGRSLTDALAEVVPQSRGQDAAFLQELCYGVTRNYFRYLALTQAWLSKSLAKKDTDVLMLLMLGFYQLEALRVPSYAAVSATVEAVRKLRKPWAVGMANALLRRFEREQSSLESYLKTDADRYACPAWLLKQIQADWPDQWSAVLSASLSRAPMSVRRHLRHSRAEASWQALQAPEFGAQTVDELPSAAVLSTPCAVERLPGFAEGAVSVQDVSAQWAAYLLDPAPGARVLDLCAAPGGKTCHLLEYQPELGSVLAVDKDQERLGRVQSNLDRIGLKAQLVAADAGEPADWWDGVLFDAILLDAPCSATGVLRRHPDIKWLRRADDIPSLVATQQHLLASAWSTLKPGGALLYVTCSVLRAENEHVVASFLAKQPGAYEVPLPTTFGQACAVGRQILPGERTGDGFYYAKISKR